MQPVISCNCSEVGKGGRIVMHNVALSFKNHLEVAMNNITNENFNKLPVEKQAELIALIRKLLSYYQQVPFDRR